MAPLTPSTLAELIPRPLPTDPTTRSRVETVLKQGYVIIPNTFSPTVARDAIHEIDRLTTKDGIRPYTGRNDFEGHRTNRIFSLPNKSRFFDQFYTLPAVLALNDYFLDPDYLFYVIQSITINPGEGQQVVHHDDATTRLPRPRAPLSAAIMVALDDFEMDNGATRVLPRSHLWGQEGKPNKKDTIPAVCPAGSVVYYLGTTFHSGGPNRSQKPRHALTIQYCQPYIRPLEDLMLSVDPRKVPEIPLKVVEMMGYKSGYPFLGSVDGMNPMKGMQRMLTWQKAPVDHNPPTFAKVGGKKEPSRDYTPTLSKL